MSTITPPDPNLAPAPLRPADDVPSGTPDAQLRIDVLRDHIDSVDAAIIRLVDERVALSRKVGVIRAASGGPRLSLRRENQIIARFVAALGSNGADLALLLLRTSRGRL